MILVLITFPTALIVLQKYFFPSLIIKEALGITTLLFVSSL